MPLAPVFAEIAKLKEEDDEDEDDDDDESDEDDEEEQDGIGHLSNQVGVIFLHAIVKKIPVHDDLRIHFLTSVMKIHYTTL